MADQNVNNWFKLADALDDASKEMVVEQASNLQTQVKSHIMGWPIYDTGRMYRSVYTKTVEGSTYKHEDELIMPEIADEPDDHTAYVAVGAVYGAIQNYGGHGIAGRPYWEPAIRNAQRALDAGMDKISAKLTKGSL